MHRFYVSSESLTQPQVQLTGGEAHHALHVLRLGAGDRVTVLNGRGLECVCEISGCSRSAVTLRVIEKRTAASPEFNITLVQALLKGKTFDFIVEKATELGTNRIVPMITDRVVSRPEAREFPHKVEKWNAAAIAAVKQCGGPWLPSIETPTTPQQFLARGESFDLQFLASLAPGAAHPAAHFRRFRSKQRRQPRSVCVWIGPEGDFTRAELELVQQSGALPITLGPLVLRADTAAVCCLSVINYELREPLA